MQNYNFLDFHVIHSPFASVLFFLFSFFGVCHQFHHNLNPKSQNMYLIIFYDPVASPYNCLFNAYLKIHMSNYYFSFRFSSEEVSAQNQVKASVQRRIRQSIADEVMPLFLGSFLFFKKCIFFSVICVTINLTHHKCSTQDLNQFWMIYFPRNPLLQLLNGLFVNCDSNCFEFFLCLLTFALFFCSCSQNHLNLVVVNNVPLFFSVRDGPYMPTLRLLHQCKLHITYNKWQDPWNVWNCIQQFCQLS